MNSDKNSLLIVDDEIELLESLSRGLKSQYHILTADSGNKALELLSTEKPHCVLMDIRMPGKDGIEVLKDINISYPQVPVIIMTGHGDEKVAIQALKYGAFSFMLKPIDLYEAKEEVDRALSSLSHKKLLKSPPQIVLVDDDQEFCKSLKTVFNNSSYLFNTYTSADDALAFIKNTNIDILITDLVLPDISGLNLVSKAQEYHDDFYTIVITGKGSKEDAINAIKHGVIDFIKKPFDINELTGSVDRGLHKLTLARELRETNQELMDKKRMLEDFNKQIKNQKNYVENIIKSITNMLIVTDIKGRIITCNEMAVQTLGYSEEELKNLNLNSLLKDENLSNLLLKLIDQKIISGIEKEYYSKQGKKIPVLFSGSVMRDENHHIQGLIFVAQDISDRKKAEKKLEKLAHYDVLTNLPNRAQYTLELKRQINYLKRNPNSNFMLALLLIDLDAFKTVNDHLGHHIGDLLLRIISQRLTKIVRKNDFIARIGGDEFVLIANNIKSEQNAGLIAQKIINTLNAPYSLSGNEISVGASIGIVIYTKNESSDSLFKHADAAMYYAKTCGRNQYQYYTKNLAIRNNRRLFIENGLRFALSKGQFYLEYQPIYQLSSQKVICIEALLRWRHQDIGDIEPDEFIPLAEEVGLILAIGNWVLKAALERFSEWRSLGFTQIKLAINISVFQIEKPDFIDILVACCDKFNVPHDMLILEITESSIINKKINMHKILFELRKYKFHISIDDFGTGYSSLLYIKDLPIDSLKIDKQFINDIESEKGNFVLKFIILLAKKLHLSLIAEGVENKKQEEFLLNNKCDAAQGFYFDKPLSEKDLIKLFQNKK